MKVYGAKAGGNPVRVALFLAEKGVEMEFVAVDLLNGAHRSAEFAAKNPFLEIPVLELDDGSCISESLAICRYLERVYPEPCLMGATPLEEATIEMWQRRVEFHIYLPARAVVRHTAPYLKVLEPVQITEWAELNRPLISKGLELIDQQLADHPFVAGEHYSVADITLLFAMTMLERLGISAADGGGNVEGWYNDVRQRPPVREVLG